MAGKKKRRKLKKSIKLALLLILIVAVGLTFFFISRSRKEEVPKEQGGFTPVDGTQTDPVDRELTFIVFDQGMGQSVLISCGGMNILVDGGPYEESDKLVEKLRPYAPSGVIDLVVISHHHYDHSSGLSAVYKNYSVKHTIYGERSDEDFYQIVEEAALEDGGMYEEDKDMSVVFPGGKCVCYIYDIEDGNENPNNNSVVVYVKYDKVSFLITGDLESDIEPRLLAYDINPTVVVAGHHGSYTSNSLLSHFKAEYTLISAGADNPYTLPDRSFLENAIKYTKNKNVYGTWKSGDLVFTTDGKKVYTDLPKSERLTIKDAGAVTQ